MTATAQQGPGRKPGWLGRGLIVYTGPSSLIAARFPTYAQNLRFFLRHGVSQQCDDKAIARFDLIVSLSRETLSHFESELRCAVRAAARCASSVRVMLRDDRCYDMETLRLLFHRMPDDLLDSYDALVYLNCGSLGPLLPLRRSSRWPDLGTITTGRRPAPAEDAPAAAPPPFWALRITRLLSATRRMVGLTINCGGKNGQSQAHVGSEGPWAVDREGLRALRQSSAVFDCRGLDLSSSRGT